jgi:hypothetical protein
MYRSVQSGIRTGLVSGAESFFVIFDGRRAPTPQFFAGFLFFADYLARVHLVEAENSA